MEASFSGASTTAGRANGATREHVSGETNLHAPSKLGNHSFMKILKVNSLNCQYKERQLIHKLGYLSAMLKCFTRS